MNEAILKMSGDIESEFQAFHAAQENTNEMAMVTNVECGSQGCTSILCIAE
ncbi:TPA: hypothetical protein ACKP22_001000 [Pseudomonas putida]